MPLNLPNLPTASTPVVDADGKMNPAWYRFFVALMAALKTIP